MIEIDIDAELAVDTFKVPHREFLMYQPRSVIPWALKRAACVGITAFLTILAFATIATTDFEHWTLDSLRVFRAELYPYSIYFSGAFAAVMGLAMFLPEDRLRAVERNDLRSQGRARSASFWCRYLAGALAIPLFVALPFGLATSSWSAPVWLQIPSDRWQQHFAQITAYMICIPTMSLAVFSVSSLAACLVRRPVYASLISIAASVSVLVIPILCGPRTNSRQLDVFVASRHLSLFITGVQIFDVDISLSVKYLAFMFSVSFGATLLAARHCCKDIARRKEP